MSSQKLASNSKLFLVLNIISSVLMNIILVLYYWLEGIILFFIPRKFRMKNVSGELVLITGGGSGLGRLLAQRFALRGANIVLWDLNEAGLKETSKIVEALGAKVWTYICDVTDRRMVYSVAEQVAEDAGPVDILINNAGVVGGKRFLDTTDEAIVKTFEVNSLAHFWTCRAFLPTMMSRNHGHIVSIASIAGLSGGVRLSEYSASKFAAVGFEESLRLELQSEGYEGIKSTCICPYFINTGMFAGVKSFIPILEPEFTADAIMTAILTDQQVVLIPKMFYWMHTLKTMLPYKAFRTVYVSLGGNMAMKSFTGRNNNAISSSRKTFTNGFVATTAVKG